MNPVILSACSLLLIACGQCADARAGGGQAFGGGRVSVPPRAPIIQAPRSALGASPVRVPPPHVYNGTEEEPFHHYSPPVYPAFLPGTSGEYVSETTTTSGCGD